MAVWTTRTSGYKLGFAALFLGAAFYLIGFGSPYWVGEGQSGRGLWLVCYKLYRSGSIECDSHGFADEGWFLAVQVMQCMAVAGIGISCLYGFVINCCQATASPSRALELMSGFSGLFGFVSVMVYVGKTEEYLSDYYQWGFALDLTGCILVIIAAVLIACTSNSTSDPNTPGTVVFSGAPSQAGGAVIVQTGQSYPPGQYAYQPPAGAPPQYMVATAPPQQGYWGAPPQQGYSGGSWNTPAPQGYSGNNYATDYSGYHQAAMTKP